MSFKRIIQLAAGSGNLNGNAAGTQVGGSALVMDQVDSDSLSVEFDLTAATNTITLFGEFQVSDDGSTWYDLRASNNAAPVVISTGTAAIVKVILPAPSGAYGWKYFRGVVRNQVATGAAGDLYVMKYRYAKVGF